DLEAAIDGLGLPAVLKTRRFGYDGKGQVRISARDDAGAAWARLGPAPCILEAWVPFERELSVIVARGADGGIASYVPVENRHEHHILAFTQAHAGIPPDVTPAATDNDQP
ncbi:ATP-grasp domain-containing protein, partial [Salmonella enterica]|uniref:ATP-grasp domain-containing protein n=1 Tax=Salmonella enterica TaxID=28901 RepID=UPI003D29EB15